MPDVRRRTVERMASGECHASSPPAAACTTASPGCRLSARRCSWRQERCQIPCRSSQGGDQEQPAPGLNPVCWNLPLGLACPRYLWNRPDAPHSPLALRPSDPLGPSPSPAPQHTGEFGCLRHPQHCPGVGAQNLLAGQKPRQQRWAGRGSATAPGGKGALSAPWLLPSLRVAPKPVTCCLVTRRVVGKRTPTVFILYHRLEAASGSPSPPPHPRFPAATEQARSVAHISRRSFSESSAPPPPP